MTERAALRWGWVLAALWAATALAVVHPAVVGLYHDDGIYVATGKSLAEGTGYRLIDLPGAPAQTKYPPLFPLVLSLVWRLAPAFPANVFWFKALGILASAAALALFQRLAIREIGLSPGASLLALAVAAVSLRLLAAANWVLAEPLFGACVALALLAAEASRPRPAARRDRRAALAGALAGAAALVHLQGLGLGLTLPLGLLLERRRRAAAYAFAAAAVPMAAWAIWRAVQPAPASPLLSYYANYSTTISPWTYGRGLSSAVRVVFGRLQALPAAAGALVVGDAPGRSLAGALLLAGAAWGAIALARRGRFVLALATGGAVALTLAVPWPASRFLLPWLPSLVALAARGLASGPRAVRLAGVSLAVAVLLAGGARTGAAIAEVERGSVPDFRALASRRGDWPGFVETARFLAEKTPAGARLGAIHDPFYFLYSGRQAVRFATFRPLVESGASAASASAGEVLDALRALGVSWLVLDPGSVDLERQGPASLELGRAIVALPRARARLVFRSRDRAHEVWQLDAATAP